MLVSGVIYKFELGCTGYMGEPLGQLSTAALREQSRLITKTEMLDMQ